METLSDLVLRNAHVVTEGDVIFGDVAVSRGRIEAIDRSRAGSMEVDCQGDYLLPGFIDVHTDNLEKHAIPRESAPWNLPAAVLSHDAMMLGAGVTTVFDSLCAGGVGSKARRDMLEPAVAILERLRPTGLLRATHYLHLRCDIIERGAADLVKAFLDLPSLRFVTFMDDQPDRDPSRAARVHEKRRKLAPGSLTYPFPPTPDEDFAAADEHRRSLLELCRARGIPTANHDDTTAEHVRTAAALGMTIAEFPITMEAAIAARDARMKVICGAPNLVRGKSYTGNVAVSELIRLGMVDILCSDYVPASLLQAVFQLASDEFGMALPDAVAMVTARPADVFGLSDRGRIAPGSRADLLRVRVWEGTATLQQVWIAGCSVIGPSPHCQPAEHPAPSRERLAG